MKKQILNYRGITLVKVESVNVILFNSAIEKTQFIGERKEGTYSLYANGNGAEEYLYMIIDTENSGYCLTPKQALPYYEAINLINMYL